MKMKTTPIFLFTISLFLLFNQAPVKAQTLLDTVPVQERFGLRLGIDLSKPLRTFLEEDYRGIEIVGDYRVYDNYYLAAEIGNEQMPYSEDYLSVTANGSYIKAGVDYNAFENWTGMENMIFGGLRYGFATFSQTLEEYTVYTDTQYFSPAVVEGPFETSGLTASWLELMVGIKVEVLRNLYLGANVQLKRMVTQSTPTNFDNLIVPGFNRTYDASSFGVGYGYNISYMIPIFKKTRN